MPGLSHVWETCWSVRWLSTLSLLQSWTRSTKTTRKSCLHFGRMWAIFRNKRRNISWDRIFLDFRSISADKRKSQFILDPTSLNLTLRLNMKDPNVESFYRKSRDFCYSVHNRRMIILKQKSEMSATSIKWSVNSKK